MLSERKKRLSSKTLCIAQFTWKKGCLLWDRLCLSKIHIRSHLVVLITAPGFRRGNSQSQKVAQKSHGNSSSPESPVVLRAVDNQSSTGCSLQDTQTQEDESFELLWSCANKHQTIFTRPRLWHSSGCLCCNFLPALIHVLPTVIPLGLWAAFIEQEHHPKQRDRNLKYHFGPAVTQLSH